MILFGRKRFGLFLLYGILQGVLLHLLLIVSALQLVLTVYHAYFQDENGQKMVNEYVRERKIGAGSYGKVVRT